MAFLFGCASSNPGNTGGGSDLAVGPGGGMDLRVPAGPDLREPPPPDMPLAAGSPCTFDNQCISGACLPFGLGQAKQCAAPCKAQADCDKLFENTFCEPQTAGQTTGFCTPNSAYHCSTCTQSSQCGYLAESCFQGPGDIALACHIDCSLSGASACPLDYTCSSVMDNGTARMLCMPGTTNVCLDSLGGYCDRVSTPQACARTNTTGTCTGERTCMTNNQRYDVCAAAAPQYLPNCGAQNPAGCMELVNPTALTGDVNNCGACNHACTAGQGCCNSACTALNTTANCGVCGTTCGAGSGCCTSGATNACISIDTTSNCGACGKACPVNTGSDYSCANPAANQCGMTCEGEYYDVDNNLANGCEKLNPSNPPTTPGHDMNHTEVRPQTDCNDGDSQETFTGVLYSDSRVHNPAPTNFSTADGSAPEWFSRYDIGNPSIFSPCEDDYNITFTTSGGGNATCYQLSFITDKINVSTAVINGHGSANISGGSGSYTDGSTVYFVIQKVCSTATQEAISYSVSYHL